MRVLLDTSALIHYLLRPGAAIRQIIEQLWLADEITVVSSPELMGELANVLARPSIGNYIQPDEGQALLDVLYAKAEMLPPLGEIPVFTRDPKDDKFIAHAVAGQVDFVITLDKDILTLEKVREIEMVTPFEFVKRWSGG
jgi:putative PIN family toxin of toxin-antitoxin system